MEIIYTPKFARSYKKLSQEIKQRAEQKELLFRKNPFAPSLRTHKLTGRLEGLFAFSIDYAYRIIFEFGEKDTIYFHAVGDHSIYE